MTAQRGWIAVDLDGTLAEYDGWRGETHIGSPIPKMVARVKQWLELDIDVRIFTARAGEAPHIIRRIQDWTELHIGARLPVTATKDYQMAILFDDRARQVEFNTGCVLGEDYQIVETDRFFADQDGDCHWYVIPEANRAEWTAWRELPSDQEEAWEPPAFARPLDGLHTLTFTDPKQS